MDQVRFMNRTDTKYVVPTRDIIPLLKGLQPHYRALDVNGIRMGNYETLYFDTPDFQFYNEHHNGKKNRVKVRYRTYLDSDITFLEVKKKNNKNRTIKLRKRVDELKHQLDEDDKIFAEIAAQKELTLMPTASNTFKRTTLVSKDFSERATIDFNLKLMLNGKSVSLPGISIIESKQDLFNRGSEMVASLKEMRFRALRISKYCLGMAMLSDNLKTNNFKKKLRKLEKLENELAS